jgi:hypothetical protein
LESRLLIEQVNLRIPNHPYSTEIAISTQFLAKQACAQDEEPRNPDAPGKSLRVMDCAGRAPAATALSPARASRELLRTVARTKAAWRFPPQSVTFLAISTRLASPFASWTAPAKRSGDGAFARTRQPRAFERRRPHESGVALPAAVHDAPRNPDAPGNPIRVMDCAGRAPAATALSPARASRELLSVVARTKAAWRFPPQPMTPRAIPTRLATPFASWTAPAERQRRRRFRPHAPAASF